MTIRLTPFNNKSNDTSILQLFDQESGEPIESIESLEDSSDLDDYDEMENSTDEFLDSDDSDDSDGSDDSDSLLTVEELCNLAYENYSNTVDILEQGPSHRDYQMIVDSIMLARNNMTINH